MFSRQFCTTPLLALLPFSVNRFSLPPLKKVCFDCLKKKACYSFQGRKFCFCIFYSKHHSKLLLKFLFSMTVRSLLYTVSLDLLRVDGVSFGSFTVFRNCNFMKLGWLGYLGTSQVVVFITVDRILIFGCASGVDFFITFSVNGKCKRDENNYDNVIPGARTLERAIWYQNEGQSLTLLNNIDSSISLQVILVYDNHFTRIIA